MRNKLGVHGSMMRTPVDVFKICPQCEGSNLFKFEGEVFCNNENCDWDSIAAHFTARSYRGQAIPVPPVETISFDDCHHYLNQEPIVA